MDDLKPRPEGGELCGQHSQVSCRFSPAADPLRQLPSASACEILELSLSTILPVLGICLTAFRCAEILGRDHQIKRPDCLPACALEHSLCVHCPLLLLRPSEEVNQTKSEFNLKLALKCQKKRKFLQTVPKLSQFFTQKRKKETSNPLALRFKFSSFLHTFSSFIGKQYSLLALSLAETTSG